jgi:hypothetical protein
LNPVPSSTTPPKSGAKMKKTVFVVLCSGFVCAVSCQNADDFYHKEKNGGITITKYRGSVKDVVIPKKINLKNYV